MLIRNLTKVTLKIGYGQDKIALPPMQVVNIDEYKYPVEYVKKHFGQYVQFLTEKVDEKADETNVPEEIIKDLEPAKGEGDVQDNNEPSTEEDAKGEGEGDVADADNTDIKDDNNDNGDADDKDNADADEENKEDEGEPAETKTAKKATNKKASKKAKKN